MIFLILFIIVSFVQVSLIFITKKQFEEVLLVAHCLIMLILYSFGISGMLNIGFYLLLVSSVVCGVLCASCAVAKKDYMAVINKFITPGFAVYTTLYILLVFITKDYAVFEHDDFSHWALAPKSMFILDQIPVGSIANIWHQTYPPGTALFQYFALKINGEYNEGILFFSMGILIISCMTIYLNQVKWRQYKHIMLYAILCFTLPLIFSSYGMNPYHTLMVDYVISLVFGVTLILIFTQDLSDKYSIFNIVVLICTMVLIKKIGIFLGVCSIILIATRLITRKVYQNTSFV